MKPCINTYIIGDILVNMEPHIFVSKYYATLYLSIKYLIYFTFICLFVS